MPAEWVSAAHCPTTEIKASELNSKDKVRCKNCFMSSDLTETSLMQSYVWGSAACRTVLLKRLRLIQMAVHGLIRETNIFTYARRHWKLYPFDQGFSGSGEAVDEEQRCWVRIQSMTAFGKALFVTGLVLMLVGLLFWSGLGKGWLENYPGDMHSAEKEFQFQFPDCDMFVG